MIRPAWFGPADRPLAGWWHLPESGEATAGVVLCPPLGREHVCSHPAYRELAVALAARGIAVLRFDYDGTGDSAGALDDPDRTGAWVDSIQAAAQALRAAGAPRVGLVGMRVGATLATAAARTGAVDALVAWDPISSIGSWLRHQRALLTMSVAAEAGTGDAVETPGYVFAAETVEGLRALDEAGAPPTVPTLALLRPGARRKPERFGPDTTWGEALGQPELLDVAEYDAIAPVATIADVIDWLAGTLGTGTATPITAPATQQAVVLADTPAGPVSEQLLELAGGQLYGVLSAPERSGGPLVVLLNNGTELHTGPSRLWVSLARNWSAAGLRVLRMDLSGIGDSPPRPGRQPRVMYAPEALDDVRDAVSAIGAGPVVLAGLCAGAYTAVEAGIALRADGVVAVNPPTWLETAEEAAGGPVDPRRQATRATAVPWLRQAANGPLKAATARLPTAAWSLLDRLAIRPSPAAGMRALALAGTDVLVLFGEEDAEPFLQRAGSLLRKLERRTGLRAEVITGLDHAALAAEPRARLAARMQDYVLEHYAPSPRGARTQA